MCVRTSALRRYITKKKCEYPLRYSALQCCQRITTGATPSTCSALRRAGMLPEHTHGQANRAQGPCSLSRDGGLWPMIRMARTFGSMPLLPGCILNLRAINVYVLNLGLHATKGTEFASLIFCPACLVSQGPNTLRQLFSLDAKLLCYASRPAKTCWAAASHSHPPQPVLRVYLQDASLAPLQHQVFNRKGLAEGTVR